MSAAQGAQDYHAVMRSRLNRLCRECEFKKESHNCLCKKNKTDCVFYNLIIAETVLSEYPAKALKEISLDAFVRGFRLLGFSGTLEKTRTVKI